MIEFPRTEDDRSPRLPAALALFNFVFSALLHLGCREVLDTRPLARLERAANGLGSDLRGELLPEDGPKEVARAATAFNANAAAHCRAGRGTNSRFPGGDYGAVQNPITRMRLRADFLGDSDAKEKLQGDLQEMQTLVKEGLALARGRDQLREQRCQTDLHALVDSLVCDYSDAGKPLRFAGERGVTILTHPQALRRIMTNLIDNGLEIRRGRRSRHRWATVERHRDDRIGTGAPVSPTSI